MGAYKTTFLADIEKEYGAKMAPEGGWSLAKNFPGGSSAEEKHTLENCSVFDLCHKAVFRVTGTEVLKKLSAVLEFNADDAALNMAVSGVFAGEKCIVLTMAEDDVLLLTECHKTAETISSELPDVDFYDLSDALARLEVAGAKLAAVLADFDIPEEEIPQGNTVVKRVVAEVNTILFAAPDRSIPSVTLLFNAEYAEGMWEEFVETYPVKPAGFAAWNSLFCKSED